MEKLKELRECMDKLKERTKELNDKHNTWILGLT